MPAERPESSKHLSSGATQPRRRRAARGCGAVFFAFMVILAGVWGGALGAFVHLLEGSETTIAALDEFRPKVGSRVYSSDGELLGEYSREWRQLVPLNEMPLALKKAFVATEDDKFYTHRGVRPDAILNAVVYRLQTGRTRGGSTITQQLVRNVDPLNVGLEVTIQRKLREAVVALQVERLYTKDEILELYLNQLFLGGRAQGVEAAAQQYFSKSCRDLTLGESALMAGLARAPNKNRPDRHPENALARKKIVLDQMVANGLVSQAEYDVAMAENLDDSLVTPEERAEMMMKGEGKLRPNQFLAPYFVEEARTRTMDAGYVTDEELYQQGLQIYTTLDMGLQRAAEAALLPWLDSFDELKLEYLKKREREDEFVPVSGGLVCIDNRPGYEGYVRALVGGRDWDKEQFNTVTQALRQPGSSVKPYVWSVALSQGMTPSTIIFDEPLTRYDGLGRKWAPANFDGEFHGPVSLRVALQKSINIVSIKLVERVGVPLIRKFMQDAGVSTPINSNIGTTIALGTPDVTVLDQCVAYSTFAKGGVHTPPLFLTEIRDRDAFIRHKSLIRRKPGAIDEDVAYVMTYLMQGVAAWGSGHRTRELDRPRAGKTGTTNKSRNVWFCGFTPQYTCVVWIGYRDNRSLGEGRRFTNGQQFTGGAVASPVWTKFMVDAHKTLPKLDFKRPPGVVFYKVDRTTGLAGGSFDEAFVSGTAPPTEVPAFHENDALEKMMETQFLENIGL
ncbi:MAG: hypothetical protein GY851_18540 [bacterium]|nr:hypothetical protein [bacterium]